MWATSGRKFYYEPLYDYLIGINSEGEYDPEESIAYKWEESADHMTWTFWIRDGVTFHDGSPLTVEDVRYSIHEELLKKECMHPSPFKEFVDRWETIPPNKLVAHLNRPWPVILNHMCPHYQGHCIIYPKKYVENIKPEDFERHPIGSGPYKFLEQKEGDYIKYEARENHWRVGTPKYKYLTFKMLPEEGTRAAALRAGEVDLVQVGITRTAKLEADGYPIHEKSNAVDMIFDFLRTFDPKNPLSKKEVREALIIAIDKASILKHILMGRGNLIGHFYQMYSTSLSYKKYPVTPYDPKRAKQLLAEAGYPKGFTMYLYSFAVSVPEQKLVNEAIAAYWQAIGMDARIIELDYSAYIPIWMKKSEPPGPAAHVRCWSTKPLERWTFLYGGDLQKNFFSQTKDEVLDKLIEKYEHAVTLEEFIQADRACFERARDMWYKTGILSTSVFFAASKEVPKWNLGQGNGNYRFEYVGATK
jgi:peptide/nickel transport system substrate-binding protein